MNYSTGKISHGGGEWGEVLYTLDEALWFTKLKMKFGIFNPLVLYPSSPNSPISINIIAFSCNIIIKIN